MTNTRFDLLDDLCKEISLKIDNEQDSKNKLQLKKELYTAKLEMISILDTEKDKTQDRK